MAQDVVDTPFFLLMDGDYSYDPVDIDRFMMHADSYDHIIGFRPKASQNISITHRIGNWILTKSFNLLMGSNIPDVACGMYLMRTKKMKQLALDLHGFEVDQEIVAQILSDGKITFVPIHYRQRMGSVKAPTWRQGFHALFDIVGLARRYNPVVLFGLIAAVALVPAAIMLGYASYLFIFDGACHSGYFLATLMFFVICGQGLTVAAIGSMLRRMGRRIAVQSSID